MQNLIKVFLIALILAGLSFAFTGCTSTTEDDNTMPWAQPTGWENNKMPGMMPNYGERNY